MRIKRLSGAWLSVGALLAGCLAPLITYRLDWILRFRVSVWIQPEHPFGGAVEVLVAQARDQPATLITLVGAPVAAVVFVVVAWMRRRARVRANNRNGIGGWLAIFMLSTIIGVLINGRGFYVAHHAIWVNVRALPHLGSTVAPAFVLLVLARYLVAAVVTVACLVGLWLIVRRSSRTPAYWTILCAVLAAASVYENAIAAWEQRVGARINIALFPHADFGMSAVTGAIVAIAWCLYWVRSRRVNETFGSRGLDLFVERPSSSELATAPTSESPPMRARATGLSPDPERGDSLIDC